MTKHCHGHSHSHWIDGERMDVTKTLNKINVNYIVLLTLSTMWDSEVLPHTLPPPIHHTQSKSGDSFQTKRFLS